jgi:DNA replication protein DnaC
MREIGTELKALKLYGMASAWGELSAKGKDVGSASGNDVGIPGSRWLIEQLLDAESADRAMRSIRWQMSSARFPIHRDLAGFNFEQSCVDRKLISELSEFSFSDDAHNVVLVDGPEYVT